MNCPQKFLEYAVSEAEQRTVGFFFINLVSPPTPAFFFFFLVSRSCVFPLVLNHLDIHLDVAVISLKYSE